MNEMSCFVLTGEGLGGRPSGPNLLMSGPAELRRVMITGERLLVTDIRIKLLPYTVLHQFLQPERSISSRD